MSQAGWYEDPFGRFEYRYFDGTEWTDRVSTAGVEGTDAPVAATAAQTSPLAVSADSRAASGDPTVVGSQQTIALGDLPEKRQTAAIAELAGMGTPGAIDALADVLEHGAGGSRVEAAAALAGLDDPHAAEVLAASTAALRIGATRDLALGIVSGLAFLTGAGIFLAGGVLGTALILAFIPTAWSVMRIRRGVKAFAAVHEGQMELKARGLEATAAGHPLGVLVRRFAGWVLDMIPCWLLVSLAVRVEQPVLVAAAFGAVFGYFWWGNATGQTLGRQLLRVAVVRRDHPAVGPLPVGASVESEVALGARPGPLCGLNRTITGTLLIFFFFLPYLWALFDDDNRTLGDLVAGTIMLGVDRGEPGPIRVGSVVDVVQPLEASTAPAETVKPVEQTSAAPAESVQPVEQTSAAPAESVQPVEQTSAAPAATRSAVAAPPAGTVAGEPSRPPAAEPRAEAMTDLPRTRRDAPPTPAGWYDDPEAPPGRRFWDGNAWTEQRSPGTIVTPGRRGVPRPWLVAGGVGLVVLIVLVAFVVTRGGEGVSVQEGGSDGPTVPENVAVTDTVEVGASPDGMTFADGAIWVTNEDDGTVSRVDPDTAAVTETIEAGQGADTVAVTEEALWVFSETDGNLSRVDRETGDVTDTVEVNSPSVGAQVAGLGVSEDAVWAASLESDTVLRIDPDTAEITETVVVPTPMGIAVSEDGVWVASLDAGTVSRIDPDTTEVTDTVQVGEDALAVAATNAAVWVTSDGDNTVSRVDLESREVTDTVDVGTTPIGVATSADSIWVTDADADTMSRIDLRSRALVDTIEVGNSPRGVAVSGDAVWVANFDDGTVSRVGEGGGEAPDDAPASSTTTESTATTEGGSTETTRPDVGGDDLAGNATVVQATLELIDGELILVELEVDVDGHGIATVEIPSDQRDGMDVEDMTAGARVEVEQDESFQWVFIRVVDRG